ncbi:MAG: 50S ribosomal protein L21 [Candidatus Yonathbacteria bacterium RIFCSPHIGHO2_01_FULL_44_41]|uniref:Large ribosomal subunit protein bL21 n=1 Tax=Candidatus Yonathbacteria bacterium RIFCSPHIGHO2_02_FULL_44_14 TaxID=1802724 RepID=A0A1G2S972_9BACT|nr:MAG: 50S ribosomal protein L21 [Candidatus Yonathbacteria bacterium RIFCSPHIGHO2_01_FULL_44_41]OHA81624.1 MAG: 50S ribosomal protein L21 [Candidatus Yonathbacteria bacterium RIFCSPHIGHO2_02_FULL_44_14]OHA81805.1 MAG: 50S ribosomal protein L21 [Candidatus Yonathbacteria bacterium RIFCSPLOWO2_01_FULL_43_20]
MNFAVIQTGGKQYKVAPGETLVIEKLPGEPKVGDKIVFDQVLLVNDGSKTLVGTPVVVGASVHATLAEEGRGKKVIVIRYRNKSRYFKKNGHRQPFMKVTIDAIK